MDAVKSGADVLFIMLGAIMVLAMHAGFAFLELGTVRKKNQVNALIKILVDFAVSTIAYFFIGYSIAYGVHFFSSAEVLAQKSGFELVKFFFLLTFAAAIPAIISGGIAERAKFNPQLIATFVIVGFIYPFFEGITWNQHYGIQAWIKELTGDEFHDFAGSIVVHAVGGWLALPAILLLGARRGRYSKEGQIAAHPPSSIPFLALGAWILTVGWFGFNGGSVGSITSKEAADSVALTILNTNSSGLAGAIVAGGIMLLKYKKLDITMILNGALGGLVAITAAPDLYNIYQPFIIGAIGGALVVFAVPFFDKFKLDDPVGALSVHLANGIWGTLAVGIFTEKLFMDQLKGVVVIGVFAFVSSYAILFVLNKIIPLRAKNDEEMEGLDVNECGVEAYPEFKRAF